MFPKSRLQIGANFISNIFSYCYYYFVSGAIAKPFIMLLKELKEFCTETSIHGLGQIANDKISILKRILWLLIFVGCLGYAGNQLISSIECMYFQQFLNHHTLYYIFLTNFLVGFIRTFKWKFSTTTINDRQLSRQKIRQKISVIITNTNPPLQTLLFSRQNVN